MSTVDTKKRPREEAEGDARPSTSSIDVEVQADAKKKLPVYARKPEQLSPDDLKELFCCSVQALKDYVLSSDLLSVPDLCGHNLPEKAISELKGLIHQISKVCLQIIKPDTPCILELLSKDSSSSADWEQDKAHWMNVIVQLQMTDQQVSSILRCRESHVAAMMSLYMERAVLCKQASDLASKSASMSSLNPHTSIYTEEDSSSMGVLMKYGYLWCTRSTVALNRVLDLIKENQLKEQRTVMELFLKVVYQILSPVQAALFIIEAFPYHCDSLAMANILASVSKISANGADKKKEGAIESEQAYHQTNPGPNPGFHAMESMLNKLEASRNA